MLVRLLLAASIIALPLAGLAQTVLDMETSVARALQANLQLQQQRTATQASSLNYLQTKLAYIPSLNASIDYRRQGGTTFDLFSFQQIQTVTTFSSPNIAASTDLFRGFAKYFALRRYQADVQADRASVERVANEVTITVMGTYLSILFDDSQLEQTRVRIDLLEKQQTRVQKLYSAGAATKADVLNLEAQLALERSNLASQQNQLERDRLTLLQLLQIDLAEPVIFTKPDTAALPSADRVLTPLPEIQATALATLPNLREQEWRMKSARWQVNSARSNYYPILNLRAGLGSNYSSNISQAQADRAGYFHQMSDNFFNFTNITLSIPIFNGWQARTAVGLAKVNAEVQQILYTQAQDRLVRDVRLAWLDANTARERIKAVQAQVQAAEENYGYAEKQYQAGALNFYAYLETLNNLTRLRTQLYQARLEFYFRLMSLNLYQGKDFKLD